MQKRALKCIYPGNEYADILCLTNLPCLKERRDSLCKKYLQKIMETTHRLNYLLPCQRCNKYGVRRFSKYQLSEIRRPTNIYRNSLISRISLVVNDVKTTIFICKNRITNEIDILCMYHVACHVASHLYCLVFYILVCIVYVNPTLWCCK